MDVCLEIKTWLCCQCHTNDYQTKDCHSSSLRLWDICKGENFGRVGVTLDLFKVGWDFIRTGYAVNYGVDLLAGAFFFFLFFHYVGISQETLRST